MLFKLFLSSDLEKEFLCIFNLIGVVSITGREIA